MKSKDPGKGKGARTWQVEKFEGTNKQSGWVAGPYFGTYGHMLPPFKPCYAEITDGTLACPHCRYKGPKWQGFLPIWAANSYPTVIIFYDYHLDLVKRLRRNDPVTFTMGEEEYGKLTITPGDRKHYYRATTPERQRQADIRHWLVFKLWKSESELVNHFLAHPFEMNLPEMDTTGFEPEPKPAAKLVTVEPAATSDKPMSQIMGDVTDRVRRQNGGDDPNIDTALDAVTNRLRQKAARFSANGKAGEHHE